MHVRRRPTGEHPLRRASSLGFLSGRRSVSQGGAARVAARDCLCWSLLLQPWCGSSCRGCAGAMFCGRVLPAGVQQTGVRGIGASPFSVCVSAGVMLHRRRVGRCVYAQDRGDLGTC